MTFTSAAQASSSSPTTLGRTGWQEIRPYNPVFTYPNSYSLGNPAFYSYIPSPGVPAVSDAGWANCGSSNYLCPNADTIDMVEPNGSRLPPGSCGQAADFTFFQSLVSIPAGTTISQFSVSLSGADDGARVSIYNSANPGGLIVPGSYIALSGGTGATADLSTYMVAGEVNRVVITQMDNCPSGNNLTYAEISLNGTVVPPAPPVPTVTCTTNGNVFNTGYDASTGGVLPDNSLDANWTVAGPFSSPDGTSPANTVSLPPSGATFAAANVGDLAPTAYSPSPYGNAQWISQQTITSPTSPTGDWYYEYQFNLDSSVSPSAFSLDMNFLADNEVAEVFVNGVAQSTQTTGLPQTSSSSPYSYHGYVASNEASTVLNHNWQSGLNTIIVQIKSGQPAEAFDAQMRVASVCTANPPTITNFPSSPTYQGSFTAAVSTNGDGTLSVASSTPTVCTATGLSVTFVGAGTCTLTAHVGQGTIYGPSDGTAQSFTVNPSAATVTVTASSPSAISYGDSAPAVSPSYSGLLGTDTSIAGVSCSVSGYSVGSPAGTYSTTCTGPSSTVDYSSISYADGTVQVNPVPLTITASSETSTYGSAPGPVTPTYSGLVYTDTAPTTAPTCTTSATSSSSVGNYDTTCSGAVDPNYTITYVGGIESVTPATLLVTADNNTRFYHLADPTFTATISGFVNHDTSAAVTGSASCTTSAVYSSSVGTYPITCSQGTLAAKNYVFSYAPGTLTITQMPTNLVITSSSTSLSGNVTVSASLTEALTGLPIANETITFSAGSASASATSNPATATLSLANGRYTLSADFAGDTNYVASSTTQTLYAYQMTNFVIWGGNAGGVKVGSDVNFWGSQWSKQVTGGNYHAGASFKGYASSLNSTAGTWSTAPGNASQPPTSVAQYIGVIVATNATKSGSTISGNVYEVVVLKVDNSARYSNNPGHPANGVVQAVVK